MLSLNTVILLTVVPTTLNLRNIPPSDEDSTVILTKYALAIFDSPNYTDFLKFLDNLNSQVEHILTNSSFAGILGDSTVHHQLWLSTSFGD